MTDRARLDSPAAGRICKQLASEGIGMLRFDNLGLGDSEGDWGDGSFSNKVADTAQAVRFMNESGREVRLLVGPTTPSASRMRARSSGRPGTRATSCRWRAPTTC